MEEEINLHDLLGIFKRRIGFIINAILMGLLITALYTFFIATPQYSSTTQLLVNRSQSQEIIERSEIETNVQLINTYSDIITNRVILDDVSEILNIENSRSLSEQIEVTSENNSQVFSIRVTDDNPYNAATIANTVASVFQENLDGIMNVDNITIIAEADPNLSPVSPNVPLHLSIGLILGGITGFSAALILEMLDNTVKDERYITDRLGWTSLGRISEMTPEELKAYENNEENSKYRGQKVRTRV